VRDYFAGLFLLLEDQLHQGDVVKLDEHAGLVEEVTLRYVACATTTGTCTSFQTGGSARW
jgi:small-conductance mechanosensitive channel